MKRTTQAVEEKVEEKLDLLLELGGETIIFKVLNQPSRIVNNSRDTAIRYQAKNGIYIKSNIAPELMVDSIFIRGSNVDKHENYAFFKAPNSSEAQKLYAKFTEALEEWVSAGCPLT